MGIGSGRTARLADGNGMRQNIAKGRNGVKYFVWQSYQAFRAPAQPHLFLFVIPAAQRIPAD